jgi:ubiquinone/menaquinone biosynthesis C-methylase UbiE
VADLNRSPSLPYPDASFDCVICSLTIDYLTKPLRVTREVARVLRPGGLFAVTFSNRLFFTKVRQIYSTSEAHALRRYSTSHKP